MFEGWAADVLASYLGKYLDLPRDRLRISLWGGEGILEDVQLRVEAFEYLQLPFAIKEGSVGRLKLQIPWGRWRGGPLVVELSDVVLCVAPREESDWEEGPALRRAQAAKQAQLAAAELAKLGSRVAATGSSSGAKPAAAAAASAAAGSGTSWGWMIADYVLSFLLNRLQFAVRNVHVYFQAPENCSSEYEAFGVKLASLSTVAPGDAPSVLSLFPALQSASAAAAAAAKVIRQLHVQGWSCYWKPRRQQQQPCQQGSPAQAPHGPAAGSSHQHRQPEHSRHTAPRVESQDYLLAPVEAVLQVTVHTSGAGSASMGGSSSAGAGVLSSGLACDVFLGAGQVSMQLSSQQLVGMARLADDAAIWNKRARYGCYRPPGWITGQQAALQGLCWQDSWQEGGQHTQQPGGPEPGAQLSRTVSVSSRSSGGTGVEDLRSSSFSSAAGSRLVPTGRNNVGAPVTWRAVWQYAVQSVLTDVRERRRQQGCWSVQKSDLLARRRYVHVYQQRLDALQPKAEPAVDSATDSTADSKADGSTAAAAGAASAADGSFSESSAALQLELQRLEHHLCVEDILLCRSLAELALERRSGSSHAERCRSWFAWGASSIGGYLYPSAQQASSSNSTVTPSKANPSKQALASGGAGATMPSEADLDELLEILHIRNSDAGGAAGPSEEAAAALEAAQQAASNRAAAAPANSKPGGLAATAVIGLKWQVLRLRAALQDCPPDTLKRELLVLDIEGTSIRGNLKGGNLSTQLALQDVRLFDCCSDPGVHECVLQRLDPASPVAAIGGQLLSPSRAWGSGLTGLGLSQAQGLQRLSPEAFGWSSNAMPAVASGAHMRRAAAGAGGAPGASDGRGAVPALLTVVLQLLGSSKHVRVQLEPLQLLARPGCVVAVSSMLEQLPQDTLQQQLAAAQADIEAASGYAFSKSTHAPVAAAGPRGVRFSDGSQPRQSDSLVAAAAQQRQQQLPLALVQLQLTFVVSELLLVLPTELQYACGTNALVHLQGFKLAAARAVAGGLPAGLQTPSGEQLEYALSSSSGSDDASQPGTSKHQQLQQQLTLGLSSLFVGVHQPCPPGSYSCSPDAVPQHMYQQQQPRLQELLKLPPVQGTVWLTGRAQPAAVAAHRRRSSEAGSQQALLKISLQVPPISCYLPASLLDTAQQGVAAVAWQSQLRLPELVATYNLPLQQQLELAAVAAEQQQQQRQPDGADEDPAAASSGAAAAAVAAEATARRTPSPTESEVAQWLAEPAPATPASQATVDAERHAASPAPQLRRCDSDKLLQPAAGHASGQQQQWQQQPSLLQPAAARAVRKQAKQKQQLSQADVAALLAVPEVVLLDLELLVEELDIQYIHDAAADSCPGRQQRQEHRAASGHAASMAEVHLRLQTSLLSIGLKHSTHGTRAEAALKDLVLQDVLADVVPHAEHQHTAAAAAGAAGVLRYISSVSIEELQVAWARQLGQIAVLQEVQVAVEGLQIQGQPDDVGLFMLPASANAGSSITAAVRTTTSHTGSATSSAHHARGAPAAPAPAASTLVVVELQNIALGIDGLLHIAAVVICPKDTSKRSSTGSTKREQQPQQAGDSSGTKPMLTLEVQLSQIQLLSCSGTGASTCPADDYRARWQTADGLTQAWQPLQDASTPGPHGVACDLLLDLPYASFSLHPKQQQQQQQSTPKLMLQDLAVYLPITSQADVLLPVLHVPRVLLDGGPDVQQQEQHQPGFAAVLEQQAECHRLLVPAVACSWRPPQLQHLVQFIWRQEQQWQAWTASGATASSRDARSTEQVRLQVQDDLERQSIDAAPKQQQPQQLSVQVGDVQLLLLPAEGTSDKGLLLHWQQLEAALLKHPTQQHQQQQQKPPGSSGRQEAAHTVLQQTQVSWQDLTVSAIQQDDMHQLQQQPLGSALDQRHPHQNLAPDGPEQVDALPGQHSTQPSVYHAHQLPAVAWLSQGLASSGRQHQRQWQPLRTSCAEDASSSLAQANGNALSTQASLSRFLSTQESWRVAVSLQGSVDGGSGFYTPKESGSMRSTSSWITARSSSLSAALSLQSQQQRQVLQQLPLPQHGAPSGGAAAAAAAAVGPGSIIAAWWQAEAPGRSPPGVSPSWLQAASSLSSSLPGWGNIQQTSSGAFAGSAADVRQQLPSQLGGRSPPGRKGVRSSSSFRRGMPLGALQLSRSGQQQAVSVRSSLTAPVGAAAALSVHSHGHDDGMTDADVEFYSIAGDSDDETEKLSALGSPRSSYPGRGTVGVDAAEEEEAWLRYWKLLPLAGFGSHGCHVAASWLLLSLSATSAAQAVVSKAGAADVWQAPHPAVQLKVWQDSVHQQAAGCASQGLDGHVSRQVIAVSANGLQLQLSCKHWDLVAACILQAANAAARHAVIPQPNTVGAKQAARHQLRQRQGQKQLSQLHVALQELQLLLFVPPDVAEVVVQPRMLLMHTSSGHSSRHCSKTTAGACELQAGRRSSGAFAPWQDPGSEPTTPTAAGGMHAIHPVLPATAAAGSGQSTSCAVQTALLKLSVQLDMTLPDDGMPGKLLQVQVPTASVQLGAAPWDAAAARLCADVRQAVQQEQLLLLLAQDVRVHSGAAAAGDPTNKQIPLAPTAAAARYHSSTRIGQYLQVGVRSVSGWVSTTRLSLLLNIQQTLLQQLPAMTAAAAMAGPSCSSYTGGRAAGAATVAGGSPGGINGADLTTSGSLAGSASLTNGFALNSSSMRRRSVEKPSAEPQWVVDSSINVAVQKIAVLVSTDEPELWLLQQQQQLSLMRAEGSTSSPDRGLGPIGQGTGVRSFGAGAGLGRLAAASGYAPLSTCSTPLVEVALLPLNVRLQLLKPVGSKPGGAEQAVVQVDVNARVRADVYSVDKLGWEPVLESWAFKVGARLTPSGPSGSGLPGKRTTASISSSEVMELTVAPSCIIASKQLQALAVASKAWQGEQALMQQLLQHLAAPAAGTSLSSAGASCWLVNETGAPLSYVVADAILEPAAATAALGTCGGGGSSSSSPLKPSPSPVQGARACASARGQAAHLTPVPLRVLDVAAVGYLGRFVEQGGVSDAAFRLQPMQPGQGATCSPVADASTAASSANAAAADNGAGGASSGVKQSQLLYVQGAGRVDAVVGPVALSQMGCSVHPLRGLAASGGVLSPGSASGHARRSKQASCLVVEVSRHRYGGRLVSVHSNIQLVNSSGLALQLGHLSSMGLSAQPLPLAVLAPGDSVWLPLQVLQATTPSLCLKPAGLPSSYNWCPALDVYALLPSSNTTAATSGFWYEPAGTAAAPRATSQFLTFAPQAAGSASSLSASSSTGPQYTDAAAAAVAAVGSLVLAVGASSKPWPAGVAVQDASSPGVSHGGSIYSRSRAIAGAGSSTSAASLLWQLVVEPPAVLINQLPVAVEVSVVAGKGEGRGLAALVDSRQQLPLYGCEAAYYSKLRVQVSGFKGSSWIPLNAAASNNSARAAAVRHQSEPGAVPQHSSSGVAPDAAAAAPAASIGPRHSDAGGALHSATGADCAPAAAVPDALQLLDQRQVVLTGLQAHQPPQVLQLRICRNKLTGCLTVTVSCSLWFFNCLGSQIAIRQPGSAATPADSVGAAGPGAAAAPPGVAAFGADTAGISTSRSQVMWLPPYPWMSSAQVSGSSSDLVGLGAAAAAASSQGPPSMADAWATARRSGASGGGSSRSALQRSRSTPSLLASTAGLEFLAVTPAREHAAGAAPSSASRPTGLSAYQRRASRGEQCSQVTASTQAMQSVMFGPSPFAAAAGVASLLTSSGPAALGGAAQPPDWPQQPHEQQPQLTVRRSFSASAQLMGPIDAGELPVAHADTAQGAMQQGAGTAGWQQQETAAGEAGDAGLPSSGRTRRHSSGLHMLASGKLPQQLLSDLQITDNSAGMPAGCSSFDLLSPTHQQRLLQQMHFQRAAVAASASAASGGTQLPQSASASDLALMDSCQAVVLPLMKSDMSGWLPLLAGGDLHQLTAAAAAFAGPVSTAEVVMATPPADSALTAAAASQAAMQQRVAAAAAAADQLLADMPADQHHVLSAQQQTEQVMRRLGSPPSSVLQFALGQAECRGDGLQLSRAPSFGGISQYAQHGQQYGHSHYNVSAGGAYAPSGPGLAGLALQGLPGAAHSSFQHAHVSQGMTRRPSGSWQGAGFADLAASAAASHVAPSSSDVGYRGLHGSVGGGLSAAPPGYASSYRSTAAVDVASSTASAGVAAPVMCGWPVHMVESSSTAAAGRLSAVGPAVAASASSACGFLELQLCAAPAAIAAAMMGKGLQQVPAQWSLPAQVPLLAPQSTPGPCSIIKLPLSVPASAAAAAGHIAGSTGASGPALGSAGTTSKAAAGEAAPAAPRRRSSTRGRAAGAATQTEQGACFVSVHTEAVPGGGGAWAVHLLPTYVLVNTLATEVQLRQCDSELVLQTVAPGGHCCVLWPNAALPLKLQFRVDEPGWSWSGAASVDAPGEFLVKIRHRSRGETLLLQLDVAASSSGIVATLSGRQGGFAPYRIDNCSAEVLHVQQAGCAEQEDVLRPYSSLPYAWDEPSMPHKVLLFLRGHRPLGEFALERVGQVRKVTIPSSSRDHLSRSHAKRLLLITTYAEGPMRVLRVLDTHSHLLHQPALPVASAAHTLTVPGASMEGFSSRGSLSTSAEAGPVSYASSAKLSQQQQPSLSRPSSTSSLQGAAAAAGNSQAHTATAASAAAAAASGSTSQQLNARNRTLQLLSAFLAAEAVNKTPVDAAAPNRTVISGSSSHASTGPLKIAAPLLDVRLSLDGCGLSLASDSRELLYSSVRGVRLRFCQDALRNAVGAAIASMRVENTLYGCQYPLMLASPVSRSVFGVVYLPGHNTAGALPAGAPAAAESAESLLEGEAQGAIGGAGSDGLGAAAAAAATAAAASAAGLDALSIAHAVEDELQQQEQLAHNQHGSMSRKQLASASVSRQPSKSSSQMLNKLLQQHPQPQQQALQVLQPHHLALGILATVWRTQPSGVMCVEQLGLQLSPLALSLEGKHLKQLMEFGTQVTAAAAGASRGPSALVARGRSHGTGLAAIGNSSSGNAYTGALQHRWPPVQPPSLPTAATTAASRLKLYFEDWFVSAITLCISFTPGSWFDPSPAGLASAWSSAGSAAAAAAAAAEAAAAVAAAAEAAATAGSEAAAGASGSGAETSTAGSIGQQQAASERTDSTATGDDQQDVSQAGNQHSTGAADVGAAAAAVAAATSSPLPVYLQMALALAHAEEGAWLTLAPFSSTHIMINTESLVQVLGRHYILAAYQELPKVLASLDIFGDPARLLQALGLGFWNLVTLPAHSARWGPYRSLQRLLRGMRVMAYGVSNSIAKGSKRSKAALLPLAPNGLSWQQQQQQHGGSWGSSLAMHQAGLESGSLAALRNGSIKSAAGMAAAGSSDGSNAPGSGQDLLHVLVAGYSLTFQHLLRSFQSGQPLRGVVRAAAQTLVLPALLLLEMSESTASSFVRLLAEQVPGAVALRVPRYVAMGQLLKPYDRLESLGRALLHHTPGPFLREEFLGCVELQQGLYAVVTVGHLLVLACRTTPAAGAAAPNGGARSKGAAAAQRQAEQMAAQQEPDLAGAAASAPAAEQQQDQQQQQRAVCVQYKESQLVFVLDLRDVMMVAAEGSSLRLLCMAGDPAASAAAVADSAARQAGGTAAAGSPSGADDGSGSEADVDARAVAVREGPGTAAAATAGGASGGEGRGDVGGAASGLRELLAVAGAGSARSSRGVGAGYGRLQQRLPLAARAGCGVPTAAGAGVQSDLQGVGRWQAVGRGVVSLTDAELESAAAGAAAAVAAAADGGLVGMPEGPERLLGSGAFEGDDSNAAAQPGSWGGCKWFVGHQVPCGSDDAALQLQRLLKRSCQRVETLLASSAWPRQLML